MTNFVDRAGRWWGSKDVEIDIVAYDSLGTDIIFGECKYSKNKKILTFLNHFRKRQNQLAGRKIIETNTLLYIPNVDLQTI